LSSVAYDASMSDQTAAETDRQVRENGDGQVADRVVVSYPADLSDWGRMQVSTDHFRAYLRKTKDRVRQGDAWEEFVGVGCCGSALDVPLRVERVDGWNRLGEETTVEYEVREACGVQGGWRVQSAGGPTEM
jgi:hypothetical protein